MKLLTVEDKKQLLQPIIEYIDTMIDLSPDEDYPPDNFSTTQQKKEKQKLECHQIMDAMAAQLDHIEIALEVIDQHKTRILTKEEVERFDKELSESILNGIDASAMSRLSNGETLKMVLKMPDHVPFQIYRMGTVLFQEHHFELASELFYLLCLLDPILKDHWIGLGLSKKGVKKFEESRNAFNTAYSLDNQDPKPLLLAASCDIELNDRAGAAEKLMQAKKICKDLNITNFNQTIEQIQIELSSMMKSEVKHE